jgi:3-dehydroquinate synthetase
MLAADVADRIARVIRTLGLPTRLPRALEPAEVAATCELDKKVRRRGVNFVLLKALGAPQRVAGISVEEIAAALRRVQPT